MSEPLKILRNPFDNDQFFETEILAYQQEILTSQKTSLNFFKKTYLNQRPFFMSLQENYLKTIHFITKNAIVATILMLLALTTVTAAAAELAAPKEYKPSTILNLKSETKQVVQPVASSSSSAQASSSSVSSQVSTQTNSSITKTESTTDQTSDWKTLYQYKYGYSFKIPGYLKDYAESTDDTFLIDDQEDVPIAELNYNGISVYVVDNYSDLEKETCGIGDNGNNRRPMKWKNDQVILKNFTFYNNPEDNRIPPTGACITGNAYWTELSLKQFTDGKGIVVFKFAPRGKLQLSSGKELPKEDLMKILESLQVS